MDAISTTLPEDSVEHAVSLANEISGILRPDPDGDAILKVQGQDNHSTAYFRISSKVLRLVSPCFVGMFSPYFQEGQELLRGECPVIELEDDDAPLMGFILNVLHYRAGGEDHVMDAKRLAHLAIHCDKYDCTNALGPWVSVWFKNVEKMSQPPTEFGFMLLAAYMFNDSERFMEISGAALRELTPGFSADWENEEILTILAASIPSAMSIRIKRTLGKLEAELQSVDLLLRQSCKCYETSQLICIECGRSLPGEAKKCHPCHNTELPPKYCTSETRIAEYFAVLRKVELWPTTKPFRMCSVSDIAFRFTRAKADLRHSCTAGTSCPLLVNLDPLSERADRIKKKINGFCLRCIREDDEWEESNKCVHR